jgi:hypothetical protein
MENDVQGLMAGAAVVFALSAVAFTLQLVLWRALAGIGDAAGAPEILRRGSGLMPSALIALAALSVILLLRW